MKSLVEALAAHLAGQMGLAELVAAIQAGRSELSSHQEDVSSMILDVPDFLVAPERDAWLSSYSEIQKRLTEVEANIRDRKQIEEISRVLPEMVEGLTLHSLSLRESAWAARGPCSHGGVNELLHLLDKYLEEPAKDRFELLQVKLEVEFTRLERQAEIFQDLPEFASLGMEELLPEYQALLEDVSRTEDLPDEELDGLFARLEEWGAAYSAYDIDFVVKRYSYAPTAIPSVNLALNGQLLLVDELVVEEMVDYFVDGCLETLQAASEKFLENQSLSEVDRHGHKEILEQMLSAIETLPELEDREALKEQGSKLIDLTRRFVEIQTRSETESGSRLDYKTE